MQSIHLCSCQICFSVEQLEITVVFAYLRPLFEMDCMHKPTQKQYVALSGCVLLTLYTLNQNIFVIRLVKTSARCYHHEGF